MSVHPDRLHSMLHRRIFYQARAAQYFEKHSSKCMMLNTPNGLHHAHLVDALHFCFNYSWWSNRADINHLRALIWGKLETLTKQLFVLRMSALASFEALVSEYKRSLVSIYWCVGTVINFHCNARNTRCCLGALDEKIHLQFGQRFYQ